MSAIISIPLIERPTGLSEVKRLSAKLFGIGDAAFEALSQLTHLPFQDQDTRFQLLSRQICYLALLSQDKAVQRSPFTKAQEDVFADTAEKIRTTDRWLRYGCPSTVGLGCLNGAFGVGAAAAGIFCLSAHPVTATVLVIGSAVSNCVSASIIQPISWHSTGTAPDLSSTAQDVRQNFASESANQYMKIAARIIQITVSDREEFDSLIRLIDLDRITTLFAEKLQDQHEAQKISELLTNAVEYVLTQKTPSDITLQQEVRINLLERNKPVRRRHKH